MSMRSLKVLLLSGCVFGAALAFGQAGVVSTISSQPVVFRTPSHPQHASGKSMAGQQSLLGQGGYTSGRGERPLWEVAPAPQYTPLGDLARNAKKDHEPSKHASVVWENCLEKSARVCKADPN